MAKYTVEFLEEFENDLAQLDRAVQQRIMKWILKHLHNVDFPSRPGKMLTGNLGGYVRFRPMKDYRIVALIEDDVFKIVCVLVGHRSVIYKKSPKSENKKQ